jgi:hypothetical protein
MFIVPNFPHLRNLEMILKYGELMEDPTQSAEGKWKQDPDTDPNQRFAPQPKLFLNGDFIKQREQPCTKMSRTSFGERRVPRRGLVQVFPAEPDYYSLAREQGLHHLLPPVYQSMSDHNEGLEQMNSMTPPISDKSKSINGGSPHRGSLSEPAGTSN